MGATHSAIGGYVAAITFSKDSSPNFVLSSATPANHGEGKSPDAGLGGTLTLAFTVANGGTNVATISATLTTGDASGGSLWFEAEVVGGTRVAATAALDVGVTPTE